MRPNRVIVDLGEITNTCFVVMPFHDLYKAEYERVIKPAIEKVGLVCVRGDETFGRPTIVQDIWQSLRTCRVVVAELSGRNPNVMYEVGLAHAIGKPIVFVDRDKEEVPFDLKALRYIHYDISDPSWGDHLVEKISRALEFAIGNPNFGEHLAGINSETTLPEAPEGPIIKAPVAPVPDLSGVWHGKWLSMKREREHQAKLVIPVGHGPTFTATMTVTYDRSGQTSIVEETLTATIVERVLSLIGVNYSYVQRGASVSYSLDSFNLSVGGDGKTLLGKAVLRHGVRDVSFARIQSGSAL